MHSSSFPVFIASGLSTELFWWSNWALAAYEREMVPLAAGLLWFASHICQMLPGFLWRAELSSESHEGGPQPHWASLAGSCSLAFWQTSLNHPTEHPKQRPKDNNQISIITVSANNHFIKKSYLTTRCTGGSPFRRLSGASRGDTNGFFIIGVQGVCKSTGHLERSGSKFSGYSLGSCGLSSVRGADVEIPLDDGVEEDNDGSSCSLKDRNQVFALCVMLLSNFIVSCPKAARVSSCIAGCIDWLPVPARER